MPTCSPLELISVHVPKCAGASAITLYKSLFGLQNVLVDNVFMGAYPPIEPWTKVIHGHFSAFKYQAIYPDTPMFTVLRNPVDRVLSTYFFLKFSDFKGDPFTEALREGCVSLQQFVRTPWFQNWIALYVPYSALELMEHVFFVENLDYAASYLATRFNKPETVFPILNITPYTPKGGYRIPQRLREEIQELNQEDLRIYAEAKRRWGTQ